jgi:hypothetical protein
MEYVKHTWPCKELTPPPPIPSLALGVPNPVDKEEKPTLFIIYGICRCWMYQKCEQQLQCLDYMPIGDPATNLIHSSKQNNPGEYML